MPRLRFGLQLLALPWAWTCAAGVFLGLAILTKGLTGVALAGVAYGSYLVLSRRLRIVHFIRAALALTIAAAVAATWYIAVERENPGFLRYFFYERHVLGFFTGSQPPGTSPWWYYLPVLAAGGIPWIWYLPVLLRDEWDRRRQGHPQLTDDCDRRPMLLLGCWFVGCTLLLSVSHSKLVTYLWPVFPAVAILAAVVWVRKIEGVMCAPPSWMSALSGLHAWWAQPRCRSPWPSPRSPCRRVLRRWSGRLPLPSRADGVGARWWHGSLAARAADRGLGSSFGMRSVARLAVVRIAAGGGRTSRPRLGPALQSHGRFAVADDAGAGTGRIGPLLPRSRSSRPAAAGPDRQPGCRRSLAHAANWAGRMHCHS